MTLSIIGALRLRFGGNIYRPGCSSWVGTISKIFSYIPGLLVFSLVLKGGDGGNM
jgi:hypothetical protein